MKNLPHTWDSIWSLCPVWDFPVHTDASPAEATDVGRGLEHSTYNEQDSWPFCLMQGQTLPKCTGSLVRCSTEAKFADCGISYPFWDCWFCLLSATTWATRDKPSRGLGANITGSTKLVQNSLFQIKINGVFLRIPARDGFTTATRGRVSSQEDSSCGNTASAFPLWNSQLEIPVKQKANTWTKNSLRR